MKVCKKGSDAAKSEKKWSVMKGEGGGFGRKTAASRATKFMFEPKSVGELTKARIQGGACVSLIFSYKIECVATRQKLNQ